MRFMSDRTSYVVIKKSASSRASFAQGTGSDFPNLCKISTVCFPASKAYAPGEGTIRESSSSSSFFFVRGSGADFLRHNQEKQPGVLEDMVGLGTVGGQWVLHVQVQMSCSLQHSFWMPNCILYDRLKPTDDFT
jgi:hypothetical protein